MEENLKILVVDDEQGILNLLRDFFTQRNYKMFTAIRGEEALKILEAEKPLLVFLDMKMPGIDGVEILKIIKEKHKDTKVIVITAYDEEYKRLVDEIGVDGFLPKPFGLSELQDMVIEVVLEKKERPKVVRPKGIPTAKILIVEGASAIRAVLWYRLSSSHSGGDYKVQTASDETEAMNMLNLFKPDIVLLSYWSSQHSGKLSAQMMDSPNKPKDIIVYGQALTDNIQKAAEQVGAKTWNGSFLDPDNLDKLGNIIKEIAVKHGLVK